MASQPAARQPSPGDAAKAVAAAAAAASCRPPCASPGNPVFSCMLSAPSLLYKTTSGDYGAVAPTPPMAPCRYYPTDNSLTNHLLACGRPSHSRINTGLDRSKVYDHPDLRNLL